MMSARIPKSNLHTHTDFCDGTDSAERMVLAAIEAGMDTLGFSGHSTIFFDLECSMTREATAEYRKEILRLRKQYGDRLHILLGIEQDLYADEPASGYDYVIGSVHYLHIDGEYSAVDLSKQSLTELVNRHFSGDFYRFARHYFELVATLPQKTGCDIIGHFDLLSKFNTAGDLFDENDPRYLRPAMDALDALLARDVIFEINTGAMSRGYRKTPYPAPIFLHRIAEGRGRVTLSSDAHRSNALLYAFSEAMHIARAAGLGSLAVMTRQGWQTFSL